jgi:threonine/homoserine/homoserine lactone efflux protein
MVSDLFTGICIGFLVAAPIGPIDILCIRITLLWGIWPGFITGMGAAFADLIYGGIVSFGMVGIAPFFKKYAFFFQFLGGIILCILGICVFHTIEHEKEKNLPTKGLLYNFFGSFFLALLSPMTPLSFLGAFAVLSTLRDTSTTSAYLFTAGVFLGSTLWWAVLSTSSNFMRSLVNLQKFKRINQVSGICLFFLGIIMIALAVSRG